MLRRLQHVRSKLMLAMLATTLTALVVSGIALLVYDLRAYQQSWVNDLVTQADILGQASTAALAFDDPRTAEQNLALLKLRPQISAAAIYTAQGKLFATYKRDDVVDPKFPEAQGASGHRIDAGELVVFQRLERGNELLGTVYVRARYELFDRLKNYVVILGVVMTVSLLAALLVSTRLQAAFTEPIMAMAEAARQVITRKDFSLRVRKTTEDEIGYLVEAFNAMLIEIGQSTKALELANRTLEREMVVRRDAEKALIAADRRKDEFLATLAHELRNPLAPLRAVLELLRRAGLDAQGARSAHDMMDRQLRQLVRLVDDLLDVSRITTGKMILRKERIDLHRIIQSAADAAAPLIEQRHHQLVVALPPEPVYLDADVVRLTQVFINLLFNAAKFTDSGGRITLAGERRDGHIVVTVSDTGIGIASGMLNTIFELFSQADLSLERPYAGLGVGLTLARHLAELHGGTVHAHSEGLGRGSQFIVELPVAAEALPESAAAAPSAPAAAGFSRLRVLLVDDNVDFVDSMAALLRSMGHEVRVAYDGEAGLQMAAAFAADAMFLDIGLPKLNGYDLARQLRQMPATRDALLVAVTGWGQEEDKQRAREAGFAHHIVKPADFHQIIAILESVTPRSA